MKDIKKIELALTNLEEIKNIIEEEGSIDQDLMLMKLENAIEILNRLVE